MNLEKGSINKKKIFLSGIAGTGMSSLAGLFSELGYDVSGSDINFYPPVDTILKNLDIKIFNSFNEDNIPPDVMLCVIGNIISRGNPEAEYILNNKLEYLSMAEALYRYFIKKKRSVVVAGTHGKTTISSFVSFLFNNAGLKPGYFIGGKPENLGSNFSTGEGGEYFISEGDEYETSFFDRSSKFLKYFPELLILTALEYDHIDYFRSEEDYIYAFSNLVNQVPSKGLIISNSDYGMNNRVTEKSLTKVLTYGEKDADYLISEIIPDKTGYGFTLKYKGEKMVFRSNLMGRFDIWNITAGVIAGISAGIRLQVIKDSVSSFKGVERRLNKLAEIKNTIIFEDFAHHPTSIGAVLKSIRELFPKRRIITFLEPGSWSLKNKFFENKLIKSISYSNEIYIKYPERFGKVPESSRIDFERIKKVAVKSGKKAELFYDIAGFKDLLNRIDMSEDQIIMVLSNGRFDGLST
ncbi:MAG: Mur ligase family protein, partial [Acidobacteriota bacterium]